MTIEERATNYAEERCGRLDYATGQLAYKQGAKDQQKIDIEKACEAFVNYLRKEDLWKDMSNDDEFDWRIKFKQAMEE